MSAHRRQRLLAKLRKVANRVKTSRVATALCLNSRSNAVSPTQPCVNPVVLPVEQVQKPSSTEITNNSIADANMQTRDASEAVVQDLDSDSHSVVGQVLANEDGHEEEEEGEEDNGSEFAYLPAALLNFNFISDPQDLKPPVYFGHHLMVDTAKPAHYWLNRYEALYDSYVYTPVTDNDYEDDDGDNGNDNDSVLAHASHHGSECDDGASDMDYYVRSGVDSAATSFNNSRYSSSNDGSSSSESCYSQDSEHDNSSNTNSGEYGSYDSDDDGDDDEAASLQRRLSNSRRIFHLMERFCLTDEARQSLYRFEYDFAIQHHYFNPLGQDEEKDEEEDEEEADEN